MIFHKKKGGEKLLNLLNRPSGLRGFHGTTHEISNTLLSAGRRPHTHTRIHTHTAPGLILKLVGSHRRAHGDPAEYQNIFGRDFQDRN